MPLSGTPCGLFGALSVKLSDALRAPTAVGVNVTWTVQVARTRQASPTQLSVSQSRWRWLP